MSKIQIKTLNTAAQLKFNLFKIWSSSMNPLSCVFLTNIFKGDNIGVIRNNCKYLRFMLFINIGSLLIVILNMIYVPNHWANCAQ